MKAEHAAPLRTLRLCALFNKPLAAQIALTWIGILLSLGAYSQTRPNIEDSIMVNAFVGSELTKVIQDNQLQAIQGNTADFADEEAYTVVSLFIDPNKNACYPAYRRIKVSFSVTTTTYATFGTQTIATENFTWEVEKFPLLAAPDKERVFKRYDRAYKCELKLKGVQVFDMDGQLVTGAGAIPADVMLTMSLRRNRYNLPATIINRSVVFTGNASTWANQCLQNKNNHNVFIVNWQAVKEADGYELEWLYVDDFGPNNLNSSIGSSMLPVQFKGNSSRVRVPRGQTSFAIPLIYSRGFILVRGRPLTKGGPGFAHDVFGQWSFNNADASGKTVADFVFQSGLFSYYYLQLNTTSPVLNNLNAQYSITFSEDGKILPQGSYADGSLRVRQTNVAASVNSQNNLNAYNKKGVVTETIYDFLGRPAVSTLPAVTESGFWYKQNYNVNAAGVKYSYLDFDVGPGDDGLCFQPGKVMGTQKGASKYYSSTNPDQTNQQGLVPDAAGYPYTRVIYEGDNASRPKIQSGVGAAHRMGSGHETQYVYGNPSQEDLNRLFGTDAGWAGYYQKSMITDANGQISVTYTDLAGKTIATALAGKSPKSLEPLKDDQGNPLHTQGATISEDLLVETDSVPHGTQNLFSPDSTSLTVTRTIIVPDSQPYVFHYQFTPEDFSNNCLKNFCADCQYILKISLIDDCGNVKYGPLTDSIDGLPNATCATNTPAVKNFTVTLKPGIYTLSKTLSLNPMAWTMIVDSAMAHDTCLKKLDDFYEAPDLSCCYITCDSCLKDLGNLTDFIAQNVPGNYPDAVSATGAYNQFKSECEALCPGAKQDFCSVALEMMLQDVSPLGQYGERDSANPGASVLSLFDGFALNPRDSAQFVNSFGLIPNPVGVINPTTFFDVNGNVLTAIWRNPRYLDSINNEWKNGYFEANGNRATILITYDGNGNPVPAPQNLSDIQQGTNGDYIYPEDLASVDDLIANWDPHYAYSLIVFHPEYFKYEFCRNGFSHTTSLEVTTVNSYEYGSHLKELNVTQAVNHFLVNFYPGSALETDIILAMVEGDPFFKPTNNNSLGNQIVFPTPFPYGTARKILQYKLEHYQIDSLGTIYSAVRVAAATSNPSLMTASSNLFTLTDATWKRLATIYESEKTEAINIAANLYQYFKKDKITTGCIGSDGGMTVSPPILPPNLTSPCAPIRFFLYPQKQQRFPSNTAIAEELGLEDPVTPEQLQEYAQAQAAMTAGKCPLQSDLELLLTKLAFDGRFAASGPPLDLNHGGYLGSALFDQFPTGSYNAAITVSPTLLSIFFVTTTGGCTTTVSLPNNAPTGLVWSDFYRFHDIHLSGNNLMIWGTYNHNGLEAALELPLSSCLPGITTCTPTPVALCTTTDELKDLKDLMNAISADGHLWDGNYSLAPYNYLITTRLKDILGQAGNYRWTYLNPILGPKQFILSNVAITPNAPKILITFNNTGTSITSPNNYLFTSITQLTPTSQNPTNQNAFTLNAVNYNPGYAFFVPSGTTTFNLNATISTVNTLSPIYASSCEFPLPMECHSDAHDNLRDLQYALEAYDSAETLDPMMDSCLVWDTLFGNGQPFDINQVDSFSVVQADMSQSQDGLTSRFFTANVQLLNGDTTTIGGQVCFDLKNCTTCGKCNEVVIDIDYGALIPNYPYSATHGMNRFTLTSGTGCALAPHAVSNFLINFTVHPTLHSALVAWAAQIMLDFPGVQATVDNNNVMHLTRTLPPNSECSCSDFYVDAVIKYNWGDQSTQYDSTYNSHCCNGIAPVLNTPVIQPAKPLAVGPYQEPEPSQPPGATINPSLVGCHDPIFPLGQDTIVDPCTEFLLDLAYADAYEDYQNYLDSVRNAYTQAYRRQCMRALEHFKMTYQNNEYHYTLYYYDRAGNLVKTVPPKAVAPIALDSVINKAINTARESRTVYVPEHNKPNTTNPYAFALTTRYRYNALNQTIAQQSPDGGISRFFYDNLGRVIVSQNEKQVPNRCSYTKYDALGRITEVGEMTRNGMTLSQSNFHNPTYVSSFFLNGYTKGQFVHTYYDDPGNAPWQRNLRSRVAYVTYQPDANKLPADLSYKNASFYSYDYHGNVDKLLQYNDQIPLAGTNAAFNYQNNTVDYTYDLVSGNVLKVAYNAQKQDRFFHRYSYDDQNRLIEARTSKDDVFYDLDARYFYYHHGPLARVEYGPYKSQGADYAYTIHGWLKSINGDNQSALRDAGRDGNNVTGNAHRFTGRDAFGFALQYYQGDYTAIKGSYGATPFVKVVDAALYHGRNLYNGNIAAMSTTLKNLSTPENVEPLLQVFGYDQLNRIVGSEAYIQNTTQDVLPGWPTTATSGNNLYKTGYAYDALGNIKSLKRHNKTAFMDDLGYSYTVGKNQLFKVTDTQGNGVATYDIDNQTALANYTYDAIGNLVTDASEQIADIQWNVFGKVTAVIRSPGSTKPNLRFAYDAMGRRIQKTVILPGGTTKHEHYTLDAQGNTMAIYSIEEGTTNLYLEEQILYGSARLGSFQRKELLATTLPTSAVQTIARGKKHYELSDHLGNVHTVFSDRKRPVCGGAIPRYYEAEILNQYDYYAFGMLMEERKAAKPACTSQRRAVQVPALTMDFRAGSLEGFAGLGGATATNLGGQDKLLVKKVGVAMGWGASKSGITLVQGMSYTISFDFGLGTCFGKTVRAQLKNSAGGVVASRDVAVSGNASIAGNVAPASGNYTLEFVMLGSAACEFTVDNVVVGYGSEKVLVSCGGGEGYRFGFNGQEKTDETHSDVEGSVYDYGFRIYDSRLGRFLSVDPLTMSYPFCTPYQFSGNTPIAAIDLDGEEMKLVYSIKGNNIYLGVEVVLSVINESKIISNIQLQTSLNNASKYFSALFNRKIAGKGYIIDVTGSINFSEIKNETEFSPYEVVFSDSPIFEDMSSDDLGQTDVVGNVVENTFNLNAKNISEAKLGSLFISLVTLHEIFHGGGLLHPELSPVIADQNTADSEPILSTYLNQVVRNMKMAEEITDRNIMTDGGLNKAIKIFGKLFKNDGTTDIEIKKELLNHYQVMSMIYNIYKNGGEVKQKE